MENFHETVLQIQTISKSCSHTASHFHPLQVENCDSNSRLVVDEDDNGKFGLERVNSYTTTNHDYLVGCNLFHLTIKLLGMKWLFKHQYLEMF